MSPPTNDGYWIECLPLNTRPFSSSSPLYTAMIENFPQLQTTGFDPDQAISRLKQRLELIQADQKQSGNPLPQRHNRLSPPRRYSHVAGWLSIYISLDDQDED